MRHVDGRTIAGWRANEPPLNLTTDDLDLVDLVLSVYPELRVVLYIGQRLRAKGTVYPIGSIKDLLTMLGEDTVIVGGHRIDAESVVGMMPREWFPIAHEGEMLSMAHLALVRCRNENTRLLLEQAQEGAKP